MREVVLALLLATGSGGVESLTDKATDSDDCAGILPDSLPPSRSIITPHEADRVCGDVTVDGEGNVASLGGGRWTVVSRDGEILGSFSVGDAIPQPSGFQGATSLSCGDMPCLYHFHYNPDGTVRRMSYIGPGDACGGRIGRSIGGGSEFTRYCGAQFSLLIYDSDGSRVSDGVVF